MSKLILLTRSSLFTRMSGSCSSRLTPISMTFDQKCGKTSISSTIKTKDKLVVNKNMTLRYCHPIPLPNENKAEEKPTRRVAVLFAWMLAKEQHIEKYRNLYFKRGFDVLTVKTTPFELLLPPNGSQRVAKSALNFMNEIVEEYEQIIVHSFSVGGYQFGEVLVEMEKKGNENILKNMSKAIKGFICDSAADMEAIPYGLSRAITNNRLLATVLKYYIALHMKLFYSVATKHYEASTKAFERLIIHCPALILVSHKDVVGNPPANQRIMKCWQNNGIDVQWKCFDNSTHVGHLHKYPEEYEREIDTFLEKAIN